MAQANLVVLPKDLAYDFLLFTQRNPKSCPVLEVSDLGSRTLHAIAAEADIAKDIPRYRVYEYGQLTGEYTDVSHLWREDLVSFLIGCSFSFESALLEAGIPVRQMEEHCNVPMYRTNIPCEPAGVFSGRMVVSMRPIPYEKVVKSSSDYRRYAQGTWIPHPYRRPSCYRNSGFKSAGFWRPSNPLSWRSAGILGLRRNPSIRGNGFKTTFCYHPRAGTHVDYRCKKCRLENLLTGGRA